MTKREFVELLRTMEAAWNGGDAERAAGWEDSVSRNPVEDMVSRKRG